MIGGMVATSAMALVFFLGWLSSETKRHDQIYKLETYRRAMINIRQYAEDGVNSVISHDKSLGEILKISISSNFFDEQ